MSEHHGFELRAKRQVCTFKIEQVPCIKHLINEQAWEAGEGTCRVCGKHVVCHDR